MHQSTNDSVLFVSVASVSDSTQRDSESMEKYFCAWEENLKIETIMTRNSLNAFSTSAPWLLRDHWSSHAGLPSVQHGRRDA
jgi:hypothetical protein